DYIMVMEYIRGGSMRQFLDRIRFSFRNKFSQLYSIADGLRVIHKKGLLHRDFHSGNILNGGSFGCCYIADLGLCRPADETSQEKIFGVMPYMAPEVLLGKTYIQASDVYSFGIVAYELLSAEETENQESLNESSCQIHSRAVYHSRLLPTKEITNLLSEQFSRSLQIDFSESSQVSTEQTAQTLQPTNQPYGTPGTNK
ncbi:6263_t:CDS:2, partial [Funneliformis geosporum]